ncbi:hypothetical protein RUM44_003824 [Polyplax serrata]|uniref:EF-hand domain-containing family member C2 n=1 Tax=Polyplax serrata TaxID=468196 RepID=A0ABR1B1I1_POLSC
MIRSAKLPFLPGYDFSREVGQTRFHKSTQFEYLGGLVPYLSEADRPGCGGYPLSWVTPDTTPSLYPRRECVELPGWLAYDKQILTFEAYFQEALWEVDKCPFQIRKVKIFYFPEDGTIQVNEPKVDNSGMTQGVLIARQRIRFPKPMDHGFYDMIDFNIGKNVELFGRVFRIVNCDKFTRNFLNRMGIFVGDPLSYPTDPFRAEEEKKKMGLLGKKPRKTPPALGRYLEFDKKVLRFYGYWDDRPSQYGYVHKLEIHYFLSDDTIEIHEIIPPNSGIDSGSQFLRRMKLPKNYEKLPGPGETEPSSLLNVWPTGFLKGRYVVDPISFTSDANAGCYKENDLAIGVALNVFGRKVVLTDCDEYTKEYYRTTYGIETFDTILTPDDNNLIVSKEKEIPPWNGYGSYEDSEGNCKKVMPVAPKKDIFKFLSKGRMGVDSHILRFKAKMISIEQCNQDRIFVISYYLTDDQISIYERAARNSGYASRSFYSKREIFKPDQERFVSVKPETFQKSDLWVGNIVKFEGFSFKIINADEYCLRYMELHNQEFPKSNAKLILDKIREKIRPIYKEFINTNLMSCEQSQDGFGALSFCELKRALLNLFGNEITEQEIITVARQFRLQTPERRLTKTEVVEACRTECRKKLWMGLDRLRENLNYKDSCGTGFVPQQIALSLCKGAKVPIMTDFLNTIFEMVNKNECGDVSLDDLLNFFDTQRGPSKPTAPFNHSREFSELARLKGNYDYSWIDCNCFIKSIGLEEELATDGHAQGTENVQTTTNQTLT